MKIVIIPDVPNWAFDRIADDIIEYIPEFEFYKVYGGYSRSLIDRAQSFDVIYFMDWMQAAYYGPLFQKKINVTTGIFSHNFEYKHNYNVHNLFKQVKGVSTVTRILFDKVSMYKPKFIQYIPACVHDNIFVPTKKKRSEKFIVGWSGRPTSGGFPPNRPVDIKGYNHILKPLMNRFKKHKNITFKILANTPKSVLSHEDMATWYKDVDVQICTAISEGGPFPMFGAASCGIPLISTKVGSICEFITPGENGFIIPSYSREEEIPKTLDKFERYILQLKNDRDLAEQMGRNNREKIVKEWSWKKRAKEWKTFFERISINE